MGFAGSTVQDVTGLGRFISPTAGFYRINRSGFLYLIPFVFPRRQALPLLNAIG
jgi:hypothetical protein